MTAPDPAGSAALEPWEVFRQEKDGDAMRHAGNVRNSATLRTARHTLTAPVRWITRRG